MIPNAWSGLDFGLGDDVDQLRDLVRRFSEERIAPRAEDIDRPNPFPRDLWPELGELGRAVPRSRRSGAAPAWAISPIASR